MTARTAPRVTTADLAPAPTLDTELVFATSFAACADALDVALFNVGVDVFVLRGQPVAHAAMRATAQACLAAARDVPYVSSEQSARATRASAHAMGLR